MASPVRTSAVNRDVGNSGSPTECVDNKSSPASTTHQQLTTRADVGGDRGHAGAGRLQDRERLTFGHAGQHHDVDRRIDLPHVARAREGHGVEAEGLHQPGFGQPRYANQ